MRALRIAGIGVAAALAAAVVVILRSTREPTYAGKPLTQWINEWDEAAHGVSAQGGLERMLKIAESETAVRAIGSNAVPTLLSLLTNKPLPKDRRSANQGVAFRGFHILRQEAKDALPALVHLAKDPDQEMRYMALSCLRELDLDERDAVTAFVPLLRDGDRNIRFYAAEALCGYPEQAEKAGVFELFPPLRAFERTTNDAR